MGSHGSLPAEGCFLAKKRSWSGSEAVMTMWMGSWGREHMAISGIKEDLLGVEGKGVR